MGLHETKASARRTDPATSHQAARKVEATGAAGEQRALCLKAVHEHPGSTAAEIATFLNIERHAPSRRLSELRRGGLVYNGEPRRCRVVGSRCMTWWPGK